jgi:ABC-type branched-subunit amino acid transport system substrate-binding protein
MHRRSRLVLALAVTALVVASCGGDDDSTEPVDSATPATEAVDGTEPASTEPESTEPPATEPAEELEASDVGVTEDTVRIGVAVADLEAVRAAGISIPETLTTEHLFDRWNVFAEKWNAEGGINGRQVELVQLVWDPLDPTSFDELCATATVDEELFMVLNGTGLSGVARQCMADAGMIVIYGDVANQAELDTGRVISLAPTAEVITEAGIELWIESGEVAPGAKVGVLTNNTPQLQTVGEVAEQVLTDAGYEVKVIETNSLAGDNAATNEEGAAAVGAFQADGVEHVFLTTPFTENTGFWSAAAAAGLAFTMLDTASSQCSTFGLSRAPAGAVGSECVTTFDHPTSDGSGIRDDTEFEAACRAFFDESFSEYYGGPSHPGVPAGQKITDAAGNVLISDYAPQECTIAALIEAALTNAGVNPTRDSMMEAMLALGEVPIALASGGTGTLASDKAYMADQVHVVRVTAAGAETAPGEDGLYNGCAAPVNCGIVISDWSPIS